jgi:hypothetical protein
VVIDENGDETARVAQATEHLLQLFDRAGRARVPDERRRSTTGAADHKGWEVRIRARDEDEADDIRYLLEVVGLKAGRPYAAARRFVVPVYGEAAVTWFLERRPATDRLTRKTG